MDNGMNEEIDTTVRGVDDASGQVLTGSTNLAEAAQETSATSEELTAQATTLSGMVSVFKLRQ